MVKNIMKEVHFMNDSKRMSISLTDDMEQAIVNLRKTDRFCRSSYSEIIRELLRAGLKAMDIDQTEKAS